MKATLGQARINLPVDVGFGDAITPKPETVVYPTLLGMESPKVRAYPRETVVAEKLEAMVNLGLANSRMKDFYDLAVLSRTFSFEGAVLRDAVVATFRRRATDVPTEPPPGLTGAFGSDPTKAKQWKAFLTRSGLMDQAGDLPRVVIELNAFLWPVLEVARDGSEFDRSWRHGGPWK
jgi:hypothetical protein